MITHGTIVGVYDYRLVAVSVCIAILAAYAALDLADRITTAAGKARLTWLGGGAFAMGTGIWAMHYVGMAALRLPIPVLYDWPTVVRSALVAICASGVALSIVSRPTMTSEATIAGSGFMGVGIAAMHYMGMAAMRMPAMCLYSPWLVVLSVVLAIAASYLALRAQFTFRSQTESWSKRKFGSAIILGAAIPIMHYVGMAAVTFVPAGNMAENLSHALRLSPLGLGRIIVLTSFALTLVIVSSVIDRRFSRHIHEIDSSRLQLQSIFDNLTDAIIVLDLKRNVIQTNQAAAKLLGPRDGGSSNPTAEDFETFLPNGQLLSPEQGPTALALRGKFVQHMELIVHRKDWDHSITIEASTGPIRSLAGEVTQIIMTYRDITDRKLNVDTRARLAAIVDSSEDAIIGKDDKGIIKSWNASAERIFGYTAEEMVGQSILRLLPADLEQQEFEFLARLKRGEVIDHVETVRKTKSGKLIHVSLTISPIRDGDGKVVGASKIARDITARKQLERQLQQSQKMEAIGQLTGGIAHDFNNLLAVIVGNLGLMEQMIADNEPALKRVHTSQRAAMRGADLTRRLLAFCSNEELTPTPTVLAESIRNTIGLAERTLGPEIKITADLASDIPAVFVDPSGLESALLNLFVNARDAMPGGGTLTIKSELVTLEDSYAPVKTGEIKPGQYVAVSVTDTGTGMTRESLERAFEPFFTTKPRGKGTGLGLAMVYGFVKQSGGSVSLYSEIGYGTTVTFYLQLAKEPAKAAKALPEIHPPSAIGHKVLIVDDETDLLDIAGTYLGQMGYIAFQAADGAKALEIISREPNIALVITDVIMPGGMNGVQLIQKIRELRPGIKVIYSSGFPADALAERNGTVVDGLLLHKPYQRAEFDAIVRQTLEGTDNSTHRAAL